MSLGNDEQRVRPAELLGSSKIDPHSPDNIEKSAENTLVNGKERGIRWGGLFPH